MLKIILRILAILASLNCLSFLFARVWWYIHGDLAADLRANQAKSGSVETVFLIAGTLNQPEAAFAFAEPYFNGKNVVYAHFKPIGWDAHATAWIIDELIRQDNCTDPTICTISVGDRVSYHLRYLQNFDGRPLNFKFLAINPCPTRHAVRKNLRWMLVLGTPLFEIVCHALGWISIIPLIPTPAGNYSLVLLADQFWTITYDDVSFMPQATTNSQVILSTHDELLDNEYLREFLATSQFAEVPTKHGDTIGSANEYAAGLQLLDSGDTIS